MSPGYDDPIIPDIRLPGGGLAGTHPDALTPYTREYEREGIGRKFDIPVSETLLDTLDDPSLLIPAMMERGQDLSVAEVILSEILATMRQRTHHEGSSAIVIPIAQTAAGYTQLLAPPSANQFIRIRTIVVTPSTGVGAIRFVQGAGNSSDPALTGDMQVQVATPLAITAPNPRENPLLFTSPGLVLGIVTTTNVFRGWIVAEITQGGQGG